MENSGTSIQWNLRAQEESKSWKALLTAIS